MKKIIMSILTVWIMVSSVFTGLISFGDIENVEAPYTTHDPFRINSNAEFATMAGLEGWDGDGSHGNPYIIEGYDINGSGYGYCIYIGNTTAHFEVKDSYLHEANGVWDYPFYSDSGIILYNIQNGTIINNNVSSNDYNGIDLCESRNNTIDNNTASSNKYNGIYLLGSSNNTIINNTAFSNIGKGIKLTVSSSNRIINNTSSHNFDGFYFDLSNSNTIANNTATLNDEDGIDFQDSDSNTIANNSVLSNSLHGIYLIDSSNTIVNNTISNNSNGIIIIFSINNTLVNNEMVNNGIRILGYMLEHWNSHTIDTNNTVNGKPIYYWKNRIGGKVPSGAGQIILANSNNVVVESQNASDCSIGILMGFSSNNTIVNNTVSSNKVYGIYLYHSSNNTIVNINASNNNYGIFLTSSSNNTIANNTVSSNNVYGIFIGGSNSIGNCIYHNNIINNPNQAYDDTNNSNQWDNGYPLGGNYWSNYIGVDNFKGPNQDISGSDGIGDTNYSIDSDSVDNYPLMDPYPNSFIFLEKGWNLISIPWIQTENSIDSVLQNIQGEYDCLEWYNVSDMNDHWKINNTSKPTSMIDLNELNNKMGFWIHITNSNGVVFKFDGTKPTENQTITLYPGWNMVGYPSLTNYNRTKALNNLTFNNHIDSIWTYDAFSCRWKEIGEFDFFEVGRGYWIHAKTKCVWEVPI